MTGEINLSASKQPVLGQDAEQKYSSLFSDA